MTTHKVFEYSVSAKWLTEYLKVQSVEVDFVDNYSFGLGKNGHLMFPELAIVISIDNVKDICAKFALNYDKLIDAYAIELKKL